MMLFYGYMPINKLLEQTRNLIKTRLENYCQYSGANMHIFILKKKACVDETTSYLIWPVVTSGIARAFLVGWATYLESFGGLNWGRKRMRGNEELRKNYTKYRGISKNEEMFSSCPTEIESGYTSQFDKIHSAISLWHDTTK